jgi:hypothetical protein
MFLSPVWSLIALAMPQASTNYPDIPKNHWAFYAIADMKRQGLLVGFDNRLIRSPVARTRAEIASAFIHAAKSLSALEEETRIQFHRVAQGSSDDEKDTEEANKAQELFELVSDDEEDVVFWPRASKVFAPELRKLGVAPDYLADSAARYESLLETLAVPDNGSTRNQFRDVPANHWAAKAVLELRNFGLLDGYPVGSFKG